MGALRNLGAVPPPSMNINTPPCATEEISLGIIKGDFRRGGGVIVLPGIQCCDLVFALEVAEPVLGLQNQMGVPTIAAPSSSQRLKASNLQHITT